MIKNGDYLLIVETNSDIKYFKSVDRFLNALKINTDEELDCVEAFRLAKQNYPKLKSKFNLMLCEKVYYKYYTKNIEHDTYTGGNSYTTSEQIQGLKIKEFKTGELRTIEELCYDNYTVFKEFVKPLLFDEFTQNFTLIFSIEENSNGANTTATWGLIGESFDKKILITDEEIINQYNKYKSLKSGTDEELKEYLIFEDLFKEKMKNKISLLEKDRHFQKSNELKEKRLKYI